jgi:transmembrane sensor
MNSRFLPDSIEETAALWAARVDGDNLSEGDRAELAAWLAARADHRRIFDNYRQLAGRVDRHLDLRLSVGLQQAAQSRSVRRKWRSIAGATLAAAAAVIVLLFVLPSRRQELTTQTGERRVTTLADGSKLELNAETEVVVQLGDNERIVRLLRGQAWFNVARDPARPFRVDTPAGVVRVTGTEFDIRSADAGVTEVTVLEGRVVVQAEHGATEILLADQRASLQGRRIQIQVLPPGAARDTIAWRTGQVAFDTTPLQEAIERFAAYHRQTILLDPIAAQQRLGGRYSLDDLDGFLSSIEAVVPVQVLRRPDGAVHIVARHENKP